MNYLKRQTRKNGEDAISPVIGIMLMLVVTVIVAAVVSAFAGDLVGTKEKAPTITLDVQIKNTGLYSSSNFKATVISITDPIPTKDLKLVTSWTNTAGNSGGATVTSADNVIGWNGAGFNGGTAPWGFGPGVAAQNSGKPGEAAQQFGSYSLLGGTVMYAYPAGQSGGFMTTPGTAGYGIETPYSYTNWDYDTSAHVDGMQAVLGNKWETLMPGNTVNVKLIYVPSGTTIFNKDVVVS